MHTNGSTRLGTRCLEALDRPREVELALWFHDAIHGPLSSKNERKRADWAQNFLLCHDAPAEAAARVAELIMVTRHAAPPRSSDRSFLIDIDLSILGAEPAVYDTFEQAIRREYRHVPSVIYRVGRARLLDANAPFEQHEGQARANLARAIEQLRTRSSNPEVESME